MCPVRHAVRCFFCSLQCAGICTAQTQTALHSCLRQWSHARRKTRPTATGRSRRRKQSNSLVRLFVRPSVRPSVRREPRPLQQARLSVGFHFTCCCLQVGFKTTSSLQLGSRGWSLEGGPTGAAVATESRSQKDRGRDRARGRAGDGDAVTEPSGAERRPDGRTRFLHLGETTRQAAAASRRVYLWPVGPSDLT